MSFLKGLGESVGNIVGTLVGTSMSNRQSVENSREQRDWEERMSNTAHQREVDDLRAAGLNPVLSGLGGSGASTPSSAAATVTPYNLEKLNIASTAKQLDILDETEKKMQEETSSIKQGTRTQKSQERLNEANTLAAAASANSAQAHAALLNEQAKSVALQRKKSEAELPKVQKTNAVYDVPYLGGFMGGVNAVTETLGNVFGAANSAKSLSERPMYIDRYESYHDGNGRVYNERRSRQRVSHRSY